MLAGALKRRVTIQVPSTDQDEYGQPTDTWDELMTTWAGIRVATGKEIYAASGFTSQVSHVITLRYRPSVTIRSNCRAIHEGRIFQIQTISDPDESKAQVNLLCLEIDEGRA